MIQWDIFISIFIFKIKYNDTIWIRTIHTYARITSDVHSVGDKNIQNYNLKLYKKDILEKLHEKLYYDVHFV